MYTINENHMIGMVPKILQQIFFVILGHFLPYKNPNSKKMEKTPGDIIIFDFTQVYQKSWS